MCFCDDLLIFICVLGSVFLVCITAIVIALIVKCYYIIKHIIEASIRKSDKEIVDLLEEMHCYNDEDYDRKTKRTEKKQKEQRKKQKEQRKKTKLKTKKYKTRRQK